MLPMMYSAASRTSGLRVSEPSCQKRWSVRCWVERGSFRRKVFRSARSYSASGSRDRDTPENRSRSRLPRTGRSSPAGRRRRSLRRGVRAPPPGWRHRRAGNVFFELLEHRIFDDLGVDHLLQLELVQGKHAHHLHEARGEYLPLRDFQAQSWLKQGHKRVAREVQRN